MTNWHKRALAEIERQKDRLTDWEKNFIFSDDYEIPGMMKRFRLNLPITEKMENIILSIHERLTVGKGK